MPVRNQSGEPVDYDVQPSDPDPPPAPEARGVQIAAANGLVWSAVGAAFTGFGCLTGFGDQALILAGLAFLVVGLVFHGVAFDRARRLVSERAAFRIVRSGKTHLADGDEHPHVFTGGTWVEFWSKKDPTLMLAKSPVIFHPAATVVLRRCADPAHLAAGARIAPTDLGYHVDVL